MAQKLHVLDLKLEGSSRNHKTVCCYRTWGRGGEGQDRNYVRNVGFQGSCSLCTQTNAEEWRPGKQAGMGVLKRPLAVGNTSAAMP